MKRAALALLVIIAVVVGACAPPTTLPSSPQSPRQIEHSIQPPDSPSNLIAEAASKSIVNLQWSDNSNNEDGFKIYRDASLIATIGVNSTIYQDAGLEAGKTYHYVVKAYNVAGESGACSCSVKTLNPPLNVTINYIGVKSDHDPSEFFQGPGDIRLVLVVSDGNQTIQKVIPPGEVTYPLDDYETMELNQRVFHTASVGEYLKIGIIAYDDDQERFFSDLLQALTVLGPLIGLPDVSGISAIFSQYEGQTGKPLFENKDDYVGYFEGFWGSDESWGIGQHNAVGTGDFRVWLTIWSDSQPPPGPRPTLLPDVTIQSVDVPTEVEVGRDYTYYITLRNNETHSVTVILKIHSSVTGDVSSESVTVSANSSINVRETTRFEPAGVRIITYTIFYKGAELDSLQKTVEAKTPDVTIQSVDVPAQLEVGRDYTYYITLRNNETHSVTVILKIHSSVTGSVSSKSVTVPANSSINVRETTRFEPAGVRIITYTIFYKGAELDSLQKTVEAKAPEALSVTFDGWYVDGSKAITATKDKTVTVRLILSGGNSGQYTLRIRRDIVWASDETVNELSFSYDGTSTTKELSFVPPYATGESSTDGYHVDLLKDGYIVWTLTNAYPPRLRVTAS